MCFLLCFAFVESLFFFAVWLFLWVFVVILLGFSGRLGGLRAFKGFFLGGGGVVGVFFFFFLGGGGGGWGFLAFKAVLLAFLVWVFELMLFVGLQGLSGP